MRAVYDVLAALIVSQLKSAHVFGNPLRRSTKGRADG